ncbi:MAG TPA: TMEM175 family protein, partial [Mycobacterium sp.]|nr:TMEM175 family protein [Mycobacterium sp.]
MRPGVFERGSTEFDRALNFVDAIFGFSVTLLVTTLEVPPAAAWQSLGSLLDTGLGDQLLAFVISFVVIAGFWRGNHRLIGSFNALDGPTLRICIYLVGLVVFIPFTTKAISSPNPANLPLPTAVYAANVAAVVLV